LASVFGAQPAFFDPPQHLRANARKTFELGYQLMHSQDLPALEAAVTDIEFLMAAVQGGDLSTMLTDLAAAASTLAAAGRPLTAVWQQFIYANIHKIAKGSDSWPASRIFLQCALDQHTSTPWCKAGESWIGEGRCGWWAVRAITGQPSQTTLVHRRRIDDKPASVALVPHSAAVIAGLHDGRLLYFDSCTHSLSLFSGRELCAGRVLCAADERGRHVFATLAPNEIAIWDIETKAFVGRLGVHPAQIAQIVLLDEHLLVALSAGPSVMSAWDIRTKQQMWSLRLPDSVSIGVQPCCLATQGATPVIAVCGLGVSGAGTVTFVRRDTGVVDDSIALPARRGPEVDSYQPLIVVAPIETSRVICVFKDGTFGVIEDGRYRFVADEPIINEWQSVTGVAVTRDHVVVASSDGAIVFFDHEGERLTESCLAASIECMSATRDAIAFGTPDEIIFSTSDAILNASKPESIVSL